MTTTSHPVRQGLAASITMLAAIMLLVAGTLGILRGIAGITKDELFLIPSEYTYQFDVSTWGWIHLALGLLFVAVAIGMMVTATWARIFAYCLAALSIIANFLSLPYYPWWSMIMVGIDLVIIWAISTWNPDRV
ncbi:DUF7144 family membrane protein [Nocardia rosealba]|uniref:DUF7144 family membrane protein n=1 Tax=Nocardia rosealba TaxID=2878563 RepID=UPI001CDA45C9|nr:hypothetical protein [Nocardia rosealba]MCA2207298.1 hypothetical protein [Nocardia rosealba]